MRSFHLLFFTKVSISFDKRLWTMFSAYRISILFLFLSAFNLYMNAVTFIRRETFTNMKLKKKKI